MAWQDYQRCPGVEHTLNSHPVDVNCPSCGEVVEIWADELKARCSSCGTIVCLVEAPENSERPILIKERLMQKRISETALNNLIATALELGATDAAIVDIADISAEDELASMCLEPRCSNYGVSASCPPHVEGPEGFRKMLEHMESALFFKLEIPSDLLLSSARREIGRLVHEIAAEIERAAIAIGALNSRGFAGGSCKNIFCGDYTFCNVIEKGGRCRHPESARPSLSGYGINVNRLAESVGWKMWRQNKDGGAGDHSIGILTGLVLFG